MEWLFQHYTVGAQKLKKKKNKKKKKKKKKKGYKIIQRLHLRKTGAARGIDAVGCRHETPTSSVAMVETDL